MIELVDPLGLPCFGFSEAFAIMGLTKLLCYKDSKLLLTHGQGQRSRAFGISGLDTFKRARGIISMAATIKEYPDLTASDADTPYSAAMVS
jgi:hypothetical protein